MKILITGANGFLGSHLVKHFVNTRDDVYAISLNNYRLIDVIESIQYDSCPINSITTLEQKIHNFRPDVILHLAWSGGNSYASINSNTQFTENLPGLYDLMGIMERNRINRFICVGSAAEYGSQDEIFSEQLLERPSSLYGACKVLAKQYTEQFCGRKNINWNWIRPFYTFGPDDVPTRLIPSVINKCLRKEEVHLNDCTMNVDYLYIDDFVNGLSAILSSGAIGVFNICSGNPYSVRNIINFIAQQTNNEKNIKFGSLPNRYDMPNNIVGSNQKILKETNWMPTTEVYDGIGKTIKHYKNL